MLVGYFSTDPPWRGLANQCANLKSQLRGHGGAQRADLALENFKHGCLEILGKKSDFSNGCINLLLVSVRYISLPQNIDDFIDFKI